MAKLRKTTGTMVATSILLAVASQAQAGGVHLDLGGMSIGRAPEQQEEAAPYVAPTSKPPIPLAASDDEILLYYLPVEDSGANYAPVPTPPPLPTAPYGMVARQKPDLRSGCVLVQTEKGGLPKCPKYEVWFERDWSVPQTEEERRNVEKADALIRGAGRVIAWAFGKLGDGVDYAATKEIEAERAEAEAKTADGPAKAMGGRSAGEVRLGVATVNAGGPERPPHQKAAPSRWRRRFDRSRAQSRLDAKGYRSSQRHSWNPSRRSPKPGSRTCGDWTLPQRHLPQIRFWWSRCRQSPRWQRVRSPQGGGSPLASPTSRSSCITAQT